MTLSITWKISALDTAPSLDGFTNVVVAAHWRCLAEDGEYRAETYGAVVFQPPENAESFGPYEALSEQKVLEWVHCSVDKRATEDALAAQIDALKNPPVIANAPLPWAA